MTPQNQICANCGHNEGFHKWKGHKRKNCRKEGCPCKKFVAQTQDALTKLWDNKEDKRWNNQSQETKEEIATSEGLQGGNPNPDALRGCKKIIDNAFGELQCGITETQWGIFLCDDCQKKAEVTK